MEKKLLELFTDRYPREKVINMLNGKDTKNGLTAG